MSLLRDALEVSPPTATSPEDQIAHIAAFFWAWYFEHENDRLATIKFLFLNVTVRVHHARNIFVFIFGPPD